MKIIKRYKYKLNFSFYNDRKIIFFLTNHFSLKNINKDKYKNR